jgi:hypothetical protein
MNEFDYTQLVKKNRDLADHSTDPYYKDLVTLFCLISSLGNETKEDIVEKYVNVLDLLYERCMGADDLQDLILQERREMYLL